MGWRREGASAAWLRRIPTARRRAPAPNPGHPASTPRDVRRLLIPDGIAGITGRLGETLSAWAAAEAAPGRLLPWTPVAFGFGIVGYFAADMEPAWWAGSG